MWSMRGQRLGVERIDRLKIGLFAPWIANRRAYAPYFGSQSLISPRRLPVLQRSNRRSGRRVPKSPEAGHRTPHRLTQVLLHRGPPKRSAMVSLFPHNLCSRRFWPCSRECAFSPSHVATRGTVHLNCGGLLSDRHSSGAWWSGVCQAGLCQVHFLELGGRHIAPSRVEPLLIIEPCAPRSGCGFLL